MNLINNKIAINIPITNSLFLMKLLSLFRIGNSAFNESLCNLAEVGFFHNTG